MKVAAIIPNYNMPERTGALVEYIEKNCEAEICVVDNGSLPEFRSVHAAMVLADNVQTTNGWLMGLHYADALGRKYGKSFGAYWMLITSAEFTAESLDPLGPMVEFMESRYDAVGVHPALTEDSTTSWLHMKSKRSGGFRQVGMLDNICALWRADWFNSIGRFDPRLVYGWGVDLETSYIARTTGKTMWICEDVKVKKVTDIGYTMDRMGMDAETRRTLARENMAGVLGAKYGENWRNLMYGGIEHE